MEQTQSTFTELEAPPFDATQAPDLLLLFIATLVVAVTAYLANAAVSWVAYHSTIKVSTQHRPVPAESLSDRSHSPDDRTQTSTATPTTPARPAAAASSNQLSDEDFEQLLLHPQPQQQQAADLDHSRLNRPFRFRAPEFAAGDSGEPAFRSPQQQRHRQQVQFLTPQAVRRAAQQPLEDDSDGPAADWDPELLEQCAASSPYISSVEALQRSPAYRRHISAVRRHQLHYETSEKHKLKVYKALRDVDPPGFQQLFSRKDVQEYDQLTPSKLVSTVECLSSSLLTSTLLLLPWWLPELQPYKNLAAFLWCCLYLLAARKGCLSPIAWLLSVYSTYGEYQMLPSRARMVAAVVLETGLVVLTAGTGLGVTLMCRLLTQQRQSFGERVLQLVPKQEVVQPMHFNRLLPGGTATAG